MIELIGLFGPLLLKVGMLLGVILAIVGAYFGIKRKGAKEAITKIEQKQEEIRKDQQAKMDAAVAKDAAIDKRVKDQTDKPIPPKPVDDPKVGDIFHFMWLIPLLFLVACCPVIVTPEGVVIDIPARPVLSPCPPVPHPEGRVVSEGVLLEIHSAKAIRDYLADGPACYQQHEVILNGHIEKLENRLKAVQP